MALQSPCWIRGCWVSPKGLAQQSQGTVTQERGPACPQSCKKASWKSHEVGTWWGKCAGNCCQGRARGARGRGDGALNQTPLFCCWCGSKGQARRVSRLRRILQPLPVMDPEIQPPWGRGKGNREDEGRKSGKSALPSRPGKKYPFMEERTR